MEIITTFKGVTITEDAFNRMVIDFREAYLKKIDFEEKLLLHREPIVFLNEKEHELYAYMRVVSENEVMRDHDETTSGYVSTKVIDIWKEDKRIKSLYNAIKHYCALRNKKFDPVAIAVAEYRALNRVRSIIIRKKNKLTMAKQKVTVKNFSTEIREVYDKKYLKVFVRKSVSKEDIAAYLQKLDSVKNVNVTKQTTGSIDLTVYPDKTYDVTETQAEVEASLEAYFSTNPNDPKFVVEPISTISDKAYEQIIDQILRFGKNLESQQIKTGEEGYRDHLVAHLNSISELHSTKGEVFNRNGKTDILVADKDGNNIFIAECKVWDGEKYLLQAIDQLLKNYVNWRDEKTAIIFFNKDHKNFTDLIDTAIEAVKKHPQFLKYIGNRKDTAYSFLFKNPIDSKKAIKLELILFNFA